MARQKRYTLQELMDECDPASAQSAEERAWLDLVPAGLEVGGLGPAPEDSDKPAEAKCERTGLSGASCATPDNDQ